MGTVSFLSNTMSYCLLQLLQFRNSGKKCSSLGELYIVSCWPWNNSLLLGGLHWQMNDQQNHPSLKLYILLVFMLNSLCVLFVQRGQIHNTGEDHSLSYRNLLIFQIGKVYHWPETYIAIDDSAAGASTWYSKLWRVSFKILSYQCMTLVGRSRRFWLLCKILYDVNTIVRWPDSLLCPL